MNHDLSSTRPQSTRAITFDTTHLVSRLTSPAFTGIDRVDLAYGRHFAGDTPRIACGLHYSFMTPHRWSPERVTRLVQRFADKVADDDGSSSKELEAVRSWLAGSHPLIEAGTRPKSRFRDAIHQSFLRVANDRLTLPKGAIYLNIAQHALEFHRLFRWLDRRPDILPVFLVHDLLGLDRPELFSRGFHARFEARVQTIIQRAKAIIVTSEVVAERVTQEYAARSQRAVPIHIQPLASQLGDPADDDDPNLRSHGYFIAISTIQPRKNYTLLLDVWHALAEGCADPPKLVIVGAHGWNSHDIIALLETDPILRRQVLRVDSLPRPTLRRLVANARALLMPSLAEGYGLPVAEALALGTPVIASDIHVFREVAQECAAFLPPTAVDAWVQTIQDMRTADGYKSAQIAAHRFLHPTSSQYFSGVERFLSNL